jgi:hypothetical protein
MEMQGGGLIPQLVVEVDDDPVPDGGVDDGDGPLTVDANDGTFIQTIWIGGHPGDIEVIGLGGGPGETEQAEQDEPESDCHGGGADHA